MDFDNNLNAIKESIGISDAIEIKFDIKNAKVKRVFKFYKSDVGFDQFLVFGINWCTICDEEQAHAMAACDDMMISGDGKLIRGPLHPSLHSHYAAPWFTQYNDVGINTLPSSGTISLGLIGIELGRTGTWPNKPEENQDQIILFDDISLDEIELRELANVPDKYPEISLADFYGKSNDYIINNDSILYEWVTPNLPYNVILNNNYWSSYEDSKGIIASHDILKYSITVATGQQWRSFRLNNYHMIVGKGGAGGKHDYDGGGAGQNGGGALIAYKTFLFDNQATIAGGGGGGGAGGGARTYYTDSYGNITNRYFAGGGGGGAGAGFTNSIGGVPGSTNMTTLSYQENEYGIGVASVHNEEDLTESQLQMKGQSNNSIFATLWDLVPQSDYYYVGKNGGSNSFTTEGRGGAGGFYDDGGGDPYAVTSHMGIFTTIVSGGWGGDGGRVGAPGHPGQDGIVGGTARYSGGTAGQSGYWCRGTSFISWINRKNEWGLSSSAP